MNVDKRILKSPPIGNNVYWHRFSYHKETKWFIDIQTVLERRLPVAAVSMEMQPCKFVLVALSWRQTYSKSNQKYENDILRHGMYKKTDVSSIGLASEEIKMLREQWAKRVYGIYYTLWLMTEAQSKHTVLFISLNFILSCLIKPLLINVFKPW